MEAAMVLQPRRWYSSPEFNPLDKPSLVQPAIYTRTLRYGAMVRKQHGPALRYRRPHAARRLTFAERRADAA
jgi:hypothetical protein